MTSKQRDSGSQVTAPYDFGGQVVVVTGGSRGMGKAMAIGFAQAGANVVIASRKLDSCTATAEEIEALTGRRTLAYSLHAGHWNEAEPFVEAVYDAFGRCDVLINNAGLSPAYDSLSQISEQLFNSVLDVNFKGPFRLSALFGERMKAAGRGAIINISSTASIRPPVYSIPYAGAKAALNAMTVGLAHAYGPEVRVNGVMPGMMRTDLTKAWEETIAEDVQLVALKRMGEPQEIVGAVMLLASSAGSYITGTTMLVNGGIP
jgi:NAD(P)-dependent dehydrogenase (short-subunit alcohol dehydrogenase family)